MREAAKHDFLTQAGWGTARVTRLAGDASLRSYDRLLAADGGTAVLMDAPPNTGEDTRPFVRIAEFLTSRGLSAPRILARDSARGFLLLEDLGDDLLARVVAADPEREMPLYAAATDALAHLHSAPPPDGLKPYGPDLMAEMACLPHDWYLRDPAPGDRVAFGALVRETIHRVAGPPSVLVLRDYHAENLLWLPDRTGPARIGQLDFQDAMLGYPAYDLVSLLQDARRDVSPAVEAAMIDRYIATTGVDAQRFRESYWLMGVQRALRLYGVFPRLSLKYGKPHYVEFLPRVHFYLERCLDRGGFDDLIAAVRARFAAPTPERLTELKDKCGTFRAD
ncbi:aminoglycoside phosphotransferase family protein [Pseudooceanicola aestuarii]|uniref:aminoglycoside phosphotransferase family protein n=1 Tax=Pseudooceanicola aestuarii TaxID=2697319 RepID=UPI0013D8D8D3|nr:phosphotransferase [Pseudooceanicola aestuarii]